MSEKNIEPTAIELAKASAESPDGVNLIAILSIAISLKRIADALYVQGSGSFQENLFDMINDIRHNTRP